jgi:hypothetical protein
MKDLTLNEYELQAKLEKLYWRRERADVGTAEYEEVDAELQLVNDDLDKIRSERCEDHMTRIYPQGGYDRCANCGSRF